MKNIKVKPLTAAIVILITIIGCYGFYRSMANLNEESFYRGFNTGSEAQKMLDDLNNPKVDKPDIKADKRKFKV